MSLDNQDCQTYTSPSGTHRVCLDLNFNEYEDGEISSFVYLHVDRLTGTARSVTADVVLKIGSRVLARETMSTPDGAADLWYDTNYAQPGDAGKQICAEIEEVRW